VTIPTAILNDVLEDLAALNLAGEASPGTRSLLENYAREHPEFAARLTASVALKVPAPPATSRADAALKALQHTREYIRLRTIFTAMAIAFTFLPLAFTFGPNGIRFLFLHDQSGLVSAFWTIAAASWVAMGVMHHSIRKTGL
jgi:hypothetical protein